MLAKLTPGEFLLGITSLVKSIRRVLQRQRLYFGLLFLRCLMQINSCVNPFIYAIVIPAFRHFTSQKLSTCRRNRPSRNTEDDRFAKERQKITQITSQSDDTAV